MNFMKIIADLQIHSRFARATSQKINVPYIYSYALQKGINLVATGDWTHPLWLRELKANLEEDGSGFLKFKKSDENSSEPFSNKESSETKISSLVNSSFHSSDKHSVRILSPSDSKEDFRGVSLDPHFLLATEISSIYSQGGKLRRIHNLVWAPDFATVEKINSALIKRGCNLGSDGRPIVGLTSQEIVEIVLSINDRCLIIPAHIWTPWFSLYGSKSGFDSVEECFGDFAKYIYGIETGLSSDPVMNWRIKNLDHRAILSFSDAHSGQKLGREATVFDLEEPSYDALRKAIMNDSGDSGSSSEPFSSGRRVNSYTNSFGDTKKISSGRLETSEMSTIRKGSFGASSVNPSEKDPHGVLADNSRGVSFKNKISGTIEFYPEEGKYHYTGHRLCSVKHTPQETKKMGTICHVCGKPLTVGVMHRVEELSGRDVVPVEKNINGIRWLYHPENKKPPFVNLVPLMEIIAEVENVSAASVKVTEKYDETTKSLGPEFEILLKTPLSEIEKFGGDRLKDAIDRVRSGNIYIDPGYDGVFGVVKIWGKETEKSGKSTGSDESKKEQMSFF